MEYFSAGGIAGCYSWQVTDYLVYSEREGGRRKEGLPASSISVFVFSVMCVVFVRMSDGEGNTWGADELIRHFGE